MFLYVRSKDVDVDGQQALQAVRDVFSGVILREDITRLPPRIRVYVGVAIMLAHPNEYLFDDNIVRRSLKNILDDLLQTGVAAPEGERRSTYAVYAKRLGLYESVAQRTKPQPVRLTPPAGLVALVAELGITEPLKTFHDTAMAASVRARTEALASAVRLHAEHQAIMSEFGPRADAAIKHILAEGGDELLYAVARRIEAHL